MIDIAKHRELEAKAFRAPWFASSGPWIGLHFGVCATGCVLIDCLEKEPDMDLKHAEYIATLRNDHTAMLDELEAARDYIAYIEQHPLTSQVVRHAYRCSAEYRKLAQATKGER